MTNENTENHSIPVRLTDILHFKSLSNLSLSLDGTRAAFMIHQCNGAQDGYNSNLWIYDLSRGRTVQVTLRAPDFRSFVRQQPMPKASDLASDVIPVAMELIKRNWVLTNLKAASARHLTYQFRSKPFNP